MEGRRAQEQGADYRAIRRGWCLGREQFGKELLGAAAEQAGPNHYGADRQESGEAKAQRMVRAGMKELGWDEKELRSRPKGDKGKVKLARGLRKETTMSPKWIARELNMGSWTYVSNLLRGAKHESELEC